MAKKNLTVYEALQEKKLLEKRVKNIDTKNMAFINYASDADENISGVPRDKVITGMKGNFDSIMHLIKNIASYGAAINQSNATTKVTINEKEYTVAEAIARYNNLDIEFMFLQDLIRQYNAVKSVVEKHNTEVRDTKKIADYLNSVLGDTKRDQTLIDRTTETYLKNNLWTIIDPNELGASLQDKCDELNAFKEKFHFILTQSNAITKIDVELED